MNILKIATLGVFLSFPVTLWAVCPNLTGNYVCAYYLAHKEVMYSYSQVERDGITTYTIVESDSGEETQLIADGKSRHLGSGGGDFQTRFQTLHYCANGALIMRTFNDTQDLLITRELMQDGSLRKRSVYSTTNMEGNFEVRREMETICPQG